MRVHSKKDAGPRSSAETFRAPVPLVKRQRILYARACEIRQANDERSQLNPELAEWLALALYGIACGGNADDCLGVKPNKTERRGNFLREMRKNGADLQLESSAAKAPATVPLIQRQRWLHLYADEIRQTSDEGSPLRSELAVWLAFALRDIAFGKNAEEALDVKPDMRGPHKQDLLKAIQRKLTIGYVASITDRNDPQAVTNEVAFKQSVERFKQAKGFVRAATTVRENWNKKDADRDPEFSLTDP